jgi:hypothetical protein
MNIFEMDEFVFNHIFKGEGIEPEDLDEKKEQEKDNDIEGFSSEEIEEQEQKWGEERIHDED